MKLQAYEFYNDGKRFQYRQMNGTFQVYGKIGGESLYHICQCDTADMGQMIVDALEKAAWWGSIADPYIKCTTASTYELHEINIP